MARYLMIAVVLVALGMPVVSADVADVERTRLEFERLAAEMPYLEQEAVLHDRGDHFYRMAQPKQAEEHFRVLVKVTDGTHSKEALLSLLGHGQHFAHNGQGGPADLRCQWRGRGWAGMVGGYGAYWLEGCR